MTVISNKGITCYNVHLKERKIKRVHGFGSSPHTAAELHYSQSVTDPDFHIKLPAC